jgi:lipopolysaccharide export system protein LptA
MMPMNSLALLLARLSRVVAGVAAVGILCGSPQAFAERADKEKPAVINADNASGDDLNQTQLYTGNVVLTKGTIILRADQLTTKQDPEGYNLGVAIATQPGKLAYFKQKREGVDEYIEGQAERIEYDEKSDAVRLFNRAIVKRLAASRDADEIRGDRIDYNTRTEVYNAFSNGQPIAGSTATKPPRITVILQPKIKPGASAVPGSEPAPSRSAPSPGLDLKRETVIEAPPRP